MAATKSKLPVTPGIADLNDISGKDTSSNPWFLKRWYPFIWIALTGFLLFGQTVRFDYTYLDDHTLVLNNLEKLREISFIKKAFSEDVFHQGSGKGYYYRPVLTISFMIDAMAGKGSLALFHFSNILYHILAVYLFYLLLLRLGFYRWPSLLFSFLFLVHPMVTQAVAWIPGRNDTLLAIMVFSSLLLWIRYLDTQKKPYLIMHLLLFAAGLLTKENAIVIPVFVLFYGFTMRKTTLQQYLLAATAWITIVVIWSMMRNEALNSSSNVPFTSQVASAFRHLPAIFPFLGKMFFPVYLSVFPIMADMKIPTIMGILSIVIIAVLFITTKEKNTPMTLFGILWFLAFLIPSFVSVNNQIPNYSEHRGYLSLAGVILILMTCDPVSRVNYARRIPLITISAIIVLFGVLTFLHSRHFSDRFAFWKNATESSPTHAFNYNNLGAMYFMEKDYATAGSYFEKALKINPFEPMANSNYGLVCMNTNRPSEAEKYYLEEIRINPTYDHVYFNLGLLYYRASRMEEAAVALEKTIEVNPYYSDAYQGLMEIYKKQGLEEKYQRVIETGRAYGLIGE